MVVDTVHEWLVAPGLQPLLEMLGALSAQAPPAERDGRLSTLETDHDGLLSDGDEQGDREQLQDEAEATGAPTDRSYSTPSRT
jgi:hypothetical protein